MKKIITFLTLVFSIVLINTKPIYAENGHTAIVGNDYFMFGSDMYNNMSSIGPYYQRSVENWEPSEEEHRIAIKELIDWCNDNLAFSYAICESNEAMYYHKKSKPTPDDIGKEGLLEDGNHGTVFMTFVETGSEINQDSFWDAGLDCAGESLVATCEWESEEELFEDYPGVKHVDFKYWNSSLSTDEYLIKLPISKYESFWSLTPKIECLTGEFPLQVQKGINILKFTLDIGCRNEFVWYECYYGVGDKIELYYNPDRLEKYDDEYTQTPIKADTIDGHCVVTFVGEDGSKISSIVVEKGTNVTFPIPPEIEGKTFHHWTSDGKEIQENTVIQAVYKNESSAWIVIAIIALIIIITAVVYFTGLYKGIVIFVLSIVKSREKAVFHGIWLDDDEKNRWIKIKGSSSKGFLIPEELIKRQKDELSIADFFVRAKSCSERTIFPPKTYIAVTTIINGCTTDIIADEPADEEYLEDILIQNSKSGALIKVTIYNYLADFEYEFSYIER